LAAMLNALPPTEWIMLPISVSPTLDCPAELLSAMVSR
jgi:hypothetical protein